MPSRLSFSQYLLGHAAPVKPPFFYAYTGMWLHWLLAAGLGLILTESGVLHLLSALALASFALGLVIYALLARQYALCINIFSYAAYMATALSAQAPNPLVTVALIASSVSARAVFAREYGLYHREALAEEIPPLPTWTTALTAALILALFVFALALMS